MKFLIELTWSKAVALVMLVLAFVLDLCSDTDGLIFMFVTPFVVGLIVGKQAIDSRKDV